MMHSKMGVDFFFHVHGKNNQRRKDGDDEETAEKKKKKQLKTGTN